MATAHRDLQSNASLNNSSFTTNYSVPTRGNCTLTSSQLMSLNGLPLILTGIIAAAQLFNLIIFHLWRQKEPFVLFHVALAYYSLFIGILAAGTPIVRMFPWSERVSVPLTITLLNCFEFIRTLSLVTLLCISADRWLSVEFAVKYRAHISKKRVRQVIAVSWFVTAVLDWPGAVLNWPYYQAFCYRPPIDTGSGIGRLVWKIFTGPLIVALLLLCQGRIIFTAVRLKSRQLLSRARTRSIAVAAAPSVHHPMVRIVWSSLRASMVILLAVVISEVPFMVFANGSFGGDSVMVRFIFMLPSLQHIYSLVIYLAFFPQFRAIVCRCRQLPRGAEVGGHANSGQQRKISRIVHLRVE